MYLFIARLGEVLVPVANPKEWLRCAGTYDFVYLSLKLITNHGSGYGNRNNDMRGMLLAQRRNCRAHRRAGCQAIVYENDSPVAYVWGRKIIAEQLLSSFQLILFSLSYLLDDTVRDSQHVHNMLINYVHTSCSDSAHSQFLVTRHTEFAYDEDIQRSLQRLCHFKSDRHPPEWERKNNYILAISVCCKLCSQYTPCFKSISIEYHPHFPLKSTHIILLVL